MQFLLASNNKEKLAEMKRILEPLGFDVVLPEEIGVTLDKVEENGDTFAKNARIKAMSAYKKTKMPVIADDSGLCVDALRGAPGVLTARYAGEHATDVENYTKLLSRMKNYSVDYRTAYFQTSICCIVKNDKILTADGYCFGSIGYEPKGENGFGYDPVFICDDINNRTLAEISDEEKDEISHRGEAIRALAEKLKNL